MTNQQLIERIAKQSGVSSVVVEKFAEGVSKRLRPSFTDEQLERAVEDERDAMISIAEAFITAKACYDDEHRANCVAGTNVIADPYSEAWVEFGRVMAVKLKEER